MRRDISAKSARWLVLAVLMLTGCSDPPNGVFGCDTDADCPEGYSCRYGEADPAQLLCYDTPGEDAGTPEDGGPPPVDAGTDSGPPPSDAGTDAGMPDAGTDAAMPDAAMPDGGPDCSALMCSDLDTDCRTYSCDSSSPSCVGTDVTDGTDCEDGDICTWGVGCETGACGVAATACETDFSVIDAVNVGVLGAAPSANDRVYDCPVGQVPIGVSGAVTTGATYVENLTGMKIQCGIVDVVESGGSYSVSITTGALLPDATELGDFTPRGAPVIVSCPANEAIVGISGTFGSLSIHTNQLNVRCAPLTVTGDLQTGFTVTHGTPALAGTVGTRTGPMALGPSDCPSGLVGRGFSVYAGQVVDSIQLRCGEPVIRPITTGPIQGLTDSTAFTSDCPAGSYLVGFDANALATGAEAGRLGRFTPVCAAFFAYDDGGLVLRHNGFPYGSPGIPFGSAESGTRTFHRCPENDQVVAGVDGDLDAAGRVTAITIHCSTLTPSTGSPGVSIRIEDPAAITSGAIVSTGTAAGTYGPDVCPAGTVAMGTTGHAGASLGGFGLRCTQPSLPLSERSFHVALQDTHVVSGAPDTAFGANPSLEIEPSGAGVTGQSDMLMKWDLADVGAGHSVSWAAIRMVAYTGLAFGGDGNVYAFRIADDASWSESTTWNSAPAASGPALGFWFLWYDGSTSDQTGVIQTPLLAEVIRQESVIDDRLTTRHTSQGYRTSYRSREFGTVSQRPTLEIFHRGLLP